MIQGNLMGSTLPDDIWTSWHDFWGHVVNASLLICYVRLLIEADILLGFGVCWVFSHDLHRTRCINFTDLPCWVLRNLYWNYILWGCILCELWESRLCKAQLDTCLLLVLVVAKFEVELSCNIAILVLGLLQLDHFLRAEALRAVSVRLETCLDLIDVAVLKRRRLYVSLRVCILRLLLSRLCLSDVWILLWRYLDRDINLVLAFDKLRLVMWLYRRPWLREHSLAIFIHKISVTSELSLATVVIANCLRPSALSEHCRPSKDRLSLG